MSIDREHTDFAEINRSILTGYRQILPSWLPGGRFQGHEYVVQNPTRADKRPGSFKINWQTGQWADFATMERGTTPLSLYCYISNMPYKEAGLLLAEQYHATPEPPPRYRPTYRQIERQLYALKLWNDSHPADKTAVETYLRARGISCPIPDDIRFLSGHRHKPSGRIYPVMLSAVRCWASRKIQAVHRTWLMPDGSAKAPVEPEKMMLGNCKGGGVWLGKPSRKLIISEGIETGLSVQQETGCPVWAALSTSGMTGLILPDMPLGTEIIIAADNDPAGRKAAYEAADKWTKEGREVRIAFPPDSKDFNDLVMETV